jgi:hypothetical protein
VHLDGSLILLEQLDLFVKFFLTLFFDRLEGVLIEVASAPQSEQLALFSILFDLAFVCHNESKLILSVKLSQNFELFRGDFDVA